MNSQHFPASSGASIVAISRVDSTRWQAVGDDRVLGRGDASSRPDGRTFLSIDSWHADVFDRLAAAMLDDLPTPLYTVVDEGETDLTARWEHAGFIPSRREWVYSLPTDPQHTRLGEALVAEGVTILPSGAAQQDSLLRAYRTIRAEIEATAGWATMPAEIIDRPIDRAHFAVAAGPDREYVGLLRVGTRLRHARIELLAVRADHRHRGIARALLAEVLGSLHRSGIDTASAFVAETATAARTLLDGLGGARRVGSNLELVRR